jgi:lysylphosphatidylglycerol synthetase-like protein (DUF2156 family)
MENINLEQKPLIPKSIKQIKKAFILLTIFVLIAGGSSVALNLWNFKMMFEFPLLTIIFISELANIVFVLVAVSQILKAKKNAYIIAWISLVLNLPGFVSLSRSSIIMFIALIYLAICLFRGRGYYLKNTGLVESLRPSPFVILLIGIIIWFVFNIFSLILALKLIGMTS